MTFRPIRVATYAFATTLLLGCEGLFDVSEPESRILAETEPNTILKVAIGEKAATADETYTLYFSAPLAAESLVFCKLAAECTPATTGALVTTLSSTQGDRKIFKASAPHLIKLDEAITAFATAKAGEAALPKLSFKFVTKGAAGATPPATTAGGGIALVTQTDLDAALRNLASEKYQGRGSGDPGNVTAAQYIADQFKAFGLEPGNGTSYFQEFKVSRGSGKTSNVIGIIPGTDPALKGEYVLVGAHMDHLGFQGASIYYGADDNGSGTAAVMQLAKAFGSIKGTVKRTMVFVGWSGEEIGLIGSKHYVSSNQPFDIGKHVYIVNLDMIGYYNAQKGVQAIGAKKSAIGLKYIQELEKTHGVKVSYSDEVSGGSDHAPFFQKGVPGVFFFTGMHNNYHQPSDTVEKINYEGYTLITKMAFDLLNKVQADPGLSVATAPGMGLVALEREPLIDDDAAMQYDHGQIRFDYDGELESMRLQ